MKLLNENGMSLKPIAVMLVILGGLGYYIMNDIKKLQNVRSNRSAIVPVNSQNPIEDKIKVASNQQVTASAPVEASSTSKILAGSICGVVTYECRGTFIGETPSVPPIPATQIDKAHCEGHITNMPQCVFSGGMRGFRLEGLNCSPGYLPIIHSGQLSDEETGEGATKTTNFFQLLMVLCVKQ